MGILQCGYRGSVRVSYRILQGCCMDSVRVVRDPLRVVQGGLELRVAYGRLRL